MSATLSRGDVGMNNILQVTASTSLIIQLLHECVDLALKVNYLQIQGVDCLQHIPKKKKDNVEITKVKERTGGSFGGSKYLLFVLRTLG